jgi:plasmid stabilization system protein ParE
LYLLSRRALADRIRILGESREKFGEPAAERLAKRIRGKLEAIGSGTAQGHLRADVPERELRFEIVDPFVIAFRPSDRVIVRIVHGARDMRRVFGPR